MFHVDIIFALPILQFILHDILEILHNICPQSHPVGIVAVDTSLIYDDVENTINGIIYR